ncbi:hypothetical protein OSB04_022956 [Centaurea solstitialis]|uniref:Uncharacterized protein n=1 Tax=Centaurea solstitialis TaxID=347529 RepID=A0AA38SJW5_9ASTR|nr:hypothetical protein OSB04_022956 [Centaurea solstitialis]
MNAAANSQINFTEENAGGSDSDTVSEDLPEYYEPISSENGIDSLDLSDKEDEEEEDERMREAMQRAFREDEMRRRAPLPAENATRVMEAMRGISFGGWAPDWAGQVPEDRWIGQLASIRQPPSSTTS